MFQAPANNTVNALPVVNVGRVNRWLKDGLDYALTIPTLILIAPLLLVIALLIKLESGGPVLYSRRVVGRHGREFNAYKFRTMYIDGNDRLIADREA